METEMTISDSSNSTHWAPIVGIWDLSDRFRPVYIAPEPRQPHKFGLCVSNMRFSDGRTTVNVRFSDGAFNESNEPAGRILFGYRSPQQEYYTVGLGGYGFAYTVSRFLPTVGWTALAAAGSRSNLVSAKDYEIAIRISGQRLTLDVDTVQVLDELLPSPIPEGQLGLFAWGNAPVYFADMRVAEEPGKAFVVMQFGEPYEELYRDVIQPVSESFGLRAEHAGEFFGPGVILADIVRSIESAKLIIAEITPPNQNVFYEVGYAHALRKPTILLAERGKDLPFDISSYRCLFYDNTIGGKRNIEEGLRKHLSSILQKRSPDNREKARAAY